MSNDGKYRSVGNLLSVAKVLYDQSFFELVKENASLKLQIFWKDYNLAKLKEAMQLANSINTMCPCVACGMAGRNDYSEQSTGMACTFKPWFENHLASLGMTIQWSTFKNENRQHICLNGSENYSYGACTWDDDSHFSHFSSKDDWVWFTYGSKLWKAESVNDPELQKLKSLFLILSKDIDDSEEDDSEEDSSAH